MSNEKLINHCADVLRAAKELTEPRTIPCIGYSNKIIEETQKQINKLYSEIAKNQQMMSVPRICVVPKKWRIDKNREMVELPSVSKAEGYNIDAYHFKYFKQYYQDVAFIHNLSQEEIDAIMEDIAKNTGQQYNPTAPHSPNSGILPGSPSYDPFSPVVSDRDGNLFPDSQTEFDLVNPPEFQEPKKHKCRCDWNELLRYGCKCGGI